MLASRKKSHGIITLLVEAQRKPIYKKQNVVGGGGTNTILVNIGKQTFERMKEQEILLEDIKQGNEEILAAVKELTEIAARMLHIWGGEKHGN